MTGKGLCSAGIGGLAPQLSTNHGYPQVGTSALTDADSYDSAVTHNQTTPAPWLERLLDSLIPPRTNTVVMDN